MHEPRPAESADHCSLCGMVHDSADYEAKYTDSLLYQIDENIQCLTRVIDIRLKQVVQAVTYAGRTRP